MPEPLVEDEILDVDRAAELRALLALYAEMVAAARDVAALAAAACPERLGAPALLSKAGEQLPTQQILHYCHPIVKKVQG